MFKFQHIQEEEKTIILFKGDMDIEITEIMEDQLIPTLQKLSQIEFDFAEVSFVDSTGIGLIMNLVQQLREQGLTVTITHLNEHVSQVFELLQIPEILGKDVFPE